MSDPRPCTDRVWVLSLSRSVPCQLRWNHDDPMSDIGGIQTVPHHRHIEKTVDGPTITITWRTR